MNKYELGLVLSANVDEEVKTETFEKAQALITRFGGTVDKVDDWGKRKLAYEIKKQTEGYYSFTTFTAEPSAPIEIENRVRIMDNVLRYLIIRQNA